MSLNSFLGQYEKDLYKDMEKMYNQSVTHTATWAAYAANARLEAARIRLKAARAEVDAAYTDYAGAYAAYAAHVASRNAWALAATRDAAIGEHRYES